MSIPLRLLAGLTAVVGIAFLGTSAYAGDAAKHVTAVAPFLDEQTVLVAHVDMSKIDVDAAVKLVGEFVPANGDVKKQIDAAAATAKAWLAQFQKGGGRDVYTVVSLTDFHHPDQDSLPFFVVPVAVGGDVRMLQAMILKGIRGYDLMEQRGTIIAGDEPVIARLRTIEPVENPHVAKAFTAVEGCAFQVILLTTDDHRRVIREMFPKLPKPVDAIDGPTLADGLLWASIGVNISPELDARLVIGSRNAEAAERMAVVWKQLLAAVASEFIHEMDSAPPRIQEFLPLVDMIKKLLQPNVEEDRLIVELKKEAIQPVIQQLLIPAVNSARQSALRSQRMNQFKQLALAFHNWSSANSNRRHQFPPAAIDREEGKPLLSWRVAILPYLEEGKIYNQFRLDEAWDSEHNKKLIEKMPDIYKDHDLDSVLSDDHVPPGYTTYVVPSGEGLVFGRREGTRIREIADGTSKTILLVEVVPDRAVIWTKPADWEVDMDHPLLGVKRTDRKGFTAARCDGSVHFMSNDVDAKKLRALLTRAGAEVVEE